jgi:hypothetical protein
MGAHRRARGLNRAGAARRGATTNLRCLAIRVPRIRAFADTRAVAAGHRLQDTSETILPGRSAWCWWYGFDIVDHHDDAVALGRPGDDTPTPTTRRGGHMCRCAACDARSHRTGRPHQSVAGPRVQRSRHRSRRGVLGCLLGFDRAAFALFSSKVPAVARVWAVIGGVAVAFGVAVVVRAAFPDRVKLTVTERETVLADGGSGSWRGYVTDERGRRWEMSVATYDRLSESDRVVCAARSWTWSNAPGLNGELTDCKSVQASG